MTQQFFVDSAAGMRRICLAAVACVAVGCGGDSGTAPRAQATVLARVTASSQAVVIAASDSLTPFAIVATGTAVDGTPITTFDSVWVDYDSPTDSTYVRLLPGRKIMGRSATEFSPVALNVFARVNGVTQSDLVFVTVTDTRLTVTGAKFGTVYPTELGGYGGANLALYDGSNYVLDAPLRLDTAGVTNRFAVQYYGTYLSLQAIGIGATVFRASVNVYGTVYSDTATAVVTGLSSLQLGVGVPSPNTYQLQYGGGAELLAGSNFKLQTNAEVDFQAFLPFFSSAPLDTTSFTVTLDHVEGIEANGEGASHWDPATKSVVRLAQAGSVPLVALTFTQPGVYVWRVTSGNARFYPGQTSPGGTITVLAP